MRRELGSRGTSLRENASIEGPGKWWCSQSGANSALVTPSLFKGDVQGNQVALTGIIGFTRRECTFDQSVTMIFPAYRNRELNCWIRERFSAEQGIAARDQGWWIKTGSTADPTCSLQLRPVAQRRRPAGASPRLPRNAAGQPRIAPRGCSDRPTLSLARP